MVIIFINIFSFITDTTAKNIKKNSLEYQSRDMKYTKFNAEIELVNYGNESKEFSMLIDGYNYREDGLNGIDIFAKDGERAVFELEGNETEIFRIDLDQYEILGGRVSQNGGGNGTIEDIVLTDDNNNKIR